jgi:hypothetical protein
LAGIVLLSLLCLAGGAALAFWQWERYSSASGTLQNLGYVLQWPLFGAFPAFLFWRLLHADPRKAAERAAERPRSGAEDSAATTGDAPAPGKLTSTTGGRSRLAYVPPTVEEQAEDAELRRYNRLLAELQDGEEPGGHGKRHSQEEHRVG